MSNNKLSHPQYAMLLKLGQDGVWSRCPMGKLRTFESLIRRGLAIWNPVCGYVITHAGRNLLPLGVGQP
jgi:hypothetical protein